MNSRDEPLAGGSPGAARLHCIFYDANLCHVSSYLKAGVMQFITAMLEAGRADPELILDDPLNALAVISRDPTFTAQIETSAGKRMSAVDVQTEFHRQAARFIETGECDGCIPGAAEILRLWGETLDLIRRRQMQSPSARLDGALKLAVLGRVMERDPSLDFSSAQTRYLDHLYASLDPEQGLYWNYERAGVVERLVSAEDIGRFRLDPPEDTRAWTRAQLLRRAAPGSGGRRGLGHGPLPHSPCQWPAFPGLLAAVRDGRPGGVHARGMRKRVCGRRAARADSQCAGRREPSHTGRRPRKLCNPIIENP